MVCGEPLGLGPAVSPFNSPSHCLGELFLSQFDNFIQIVELVAQVLFFNFPIAPFEIHHSIETSS